MATGVINEELNLYRDDAVQGEILERVTDTIKPLSANYEQTIQFEIPNQRLLHYLDPSNIYIEVQVGIEEPNGDPLKKGKKVFPINNLLHSLFSNLTVRLNNQTINESNGNYGYSAYLQHLLTFNKDYLNTQGHCFGWWNMDEEGSMNETDVTFNSYPKQVQDKTVTWGSTMNTPGARQLRFFKDNNDDETYHPVTLIGRPVGEIFYQEKFLPYNVNMTIILDRKRDSFVLMNGEGVQYKIVIKNIVLHVDYVKINPDVFAANEKRTSDVIIPIRRRVVKSYAIFQGLYSASINTLFNGQLPKRLVLCMVTNKAYEGAFDENPYNFQHFNLSELNINYNGVNKPSKPLQPNFEECEYLRCYRSLFEGTGKLDKNESIPISYDAYGSGYTVVVTDFCGDLGSADPSYKHLIDVGNITIDVKFKQPLGEAVTLLAYAEYENTIKIDQFKNVKLADF